MKQLAPNQRLILLEESHGHLLLCRIFGHGRLYAVFCVISCVSTCLNMTSSYSPHLLDQPPSNPATWPPTSNAQVHHPDPCFHRGHRVSTEPTGPTRPTWRTRTLAVRPNQAPTPPSQPPSLNAAATRRPGHRPGSRCPSPPCPPDGPSSTGSPYSPSSPVSPSHPATWAAYWPFHELWWELWRNQMMDKIPACALPAQYGCGKHVGS